jgi:hypothetical protein
LGNLYPEDISERNFLFWEGSDPLSGEFLVESARDKDALLVFVVISFVVIFVGPFISPVVMCVWDRYDSRKFDKKGKVYLLFNEEDNLSFNSMSSGPDSDECDSADSSRSGDPREDGWREDGSDGDSLRHGLFDQPLASKMLHLTEEGLSNVSPSSSSGVKAKEEEEEEEEEEEDNEDEEESSCDLDSPMWSDSEASSSSDDSGD